MYFLSIYYNVKYFTFLHVSSSFGRALHDFCSARIKRKFMTLYLYMLKLCAIAYRFYFNVYLAPPVFLIIVFEHLAHLIISRLMSYKDTMISLIEECVV
jgi:hypothetical protein